MILVAGIGNIFLGDDAFGSEVARRSQHLNSPDVRVVDFGIRGLDLAYEIGNGVDAVIIVDACSRGDEPGTVYLIQPDLDELASVVPALDAHAMDPVRVLALARTLGAELRNVWIIGCEPETSAPADETMALSPRVEAAIAPAIRTVESVIATFVTKEAIV